MAQTNLKPVEEADSAETKTEISKAMEIAKRRAKSVPAPVGYRLLVVPLDVDAMTAGGLYIPEDTQALETTANIIAYVMAVGPLAYRDTDRFGDVPWCKEGDFVIVRAYSGTRMEIYGQEFRIINDDTVEAVVEDPRGVKRV